MWIPVVAKLLSCRVYCMHNVALQSIEMLLCYGRNDDPFPTCGREELPVAPGGMVLLAVPASVKGLRASSSGVESGRSVRYCSTALVRVTSPSGSTSKCCSSGASQGRAMTAE